MRFVLHGLTPSSPLEAATTSAGLDDRCAADRLAPLDADILFKQQAADNARMGYIYSTSSIKTAVVFFDCGRKI